MSASQQSSGKKKPSLQEQMQQLASGDPEDLSAELEEIEQDVVDATGFRWESESIQKQQDRVLSDYEGFLRLAKVLPGEGKDISEEEKLSMMFPEHQPTLFKQLRRFLIFVARNAPGQMAERIEYQSWVQYRDAIIFWAHRAHRLHDPPLPPIPHHELLHQITEAIEASRGPSTGAVPG